MKVIAERRQRGKTSDLIVWAAESEAPGRPRYICVADQRRAREVARRAEEMGLTIRFPVTFDEVRSHNGRNLELGVDDADLLIARVLGPHTVSVATLTLDD